MVDGQQDVEHAPQGTVGAFLDRLHHGHRPLSAPERGDPGRTVEHIPLHGSGLPPQSHACRALGIPNEADALSHQSTKDLRQEQSPVCGAPGAITKPPWKERPRQAWISTETWRLIDTSIVARQSKDGAQWSARILIHQIKASIQEDRRQRAAKSGSVVEYLLTSNPHLIREEWIRMWGWYKDSVDHPLPPSRVAIATMMSERVELYWHVPYMGQTIRVRLISFLVDDPILEEEEIFWAVRRLFLNRSGGPSGM